MFLFLIGGILPVTAGEELNSTTENDKIGISDKNTTISSSNETNINTQYEEETISENISVDTGKTPKTTLIFAEENSSSSDDIINETTIPVGNTTDQNSDNSTPALSKYETLGDIIKAKDWKALGEYNCKVKAENPEKYDDTIPTLASLQSKWNSRFTSPVTILYSPCCG